MASKFKPFQILLSEEEKTALKKQASSENVKSLSAWSRKVLLDRAGYRNGFNKEAKPETKV